MHFEHDTKDGPLMNADNTARDPLTVPVSEATPKELEAQAEYHAMNAAGTSLQKFLDDSESNNSTVTLFGEPVAITLLDIRGGETFDTLTILRLSELSLGYQVVYYRRYKHFGENGTTTHTGYGVMDGDLRMVSELDLDMLKHDKESFLTAARTLNDIKLRAAMMIAELTTRQDDTES